MQAASTQDVRDEVHYLLKGEHGMDSFEFREFLGMMYCQAIVADSRNGEIVELDKYLDQFVAIVQDNVVRPSN